MPKINSNSITFVDITDSRKLEVYIASNLPTTQIYDSNAKTYSPDWGATNLKLTADVYLDSEKVSPTTIQWYTKINTTETLVGTDAVLTIKTNELSNKPIITYVCKATYQNIKAFKEITFLRTDTGKDGTSIDILGSYDTIEALKAAHPTGEAGNSYIIDGDLYVWSIDDSDWIDVGNIQGPEGKPGENAKTIVLTANAQIFKVDKENVVSPAAITVTAHTLNTSANSWTYSTNGGQTFLDTVPTGVSRSGNIVTITGEKLVSNSLVIKASDGIYSDTLTVYKVFDGVNGTDGTNAPIAFLTNENVTFAANEKGQIKSTAFTTNVVAYSGITKVTPTIGEITGLPTGMTVDDTTLGNELMLTFTIANNTTLGSELNNNGTITIPVTSPVNTNLKLSWSKVNSGATGAAGVGIKSTTVTYGMSDSASTQPGDDAWQLTIPVVEEGKYLWTRTIIDYTDDTIADTVTYTYVKQGAKGDTGSSGSSVAVSSIQYQEGVSATTAPTGTWSNSVVTASEGKYLWTRTNFSDGKMAYGVAKQGVSGKDGVGINSTTVDYGVSDSATVKPTTWQRDIPVVAEGKYLWTRTVTDYTDTTKADTVTYVYAKQGIKGDTGTAGSSVTVKSIKYQAGTSATTAPTSTWSDSVVEVSEGNYLWTQTTFSDNKIAYGVAKQGIKGDKGDTGRGVSSIVEQYYQSTSATAQSGGSWSATVPTWVDGKYIWTRSVITYTDSTSSTTSPICITGQKGATGGVGASGVGVSSVDVWYYQSSSATSLSGGSWATTSPTWVDGKYIWTKTITTYTNNTTDETNAVCITGQKGSTGKGIKSVAEYYLATASSSGVTTSTSGWTTTVQTITVDKKYLWNYEIITYTDNTTSSTSPIIIGVFGNTGSTGATGKGIKSVTEYYLATNSASGVTTSTSGWTPAMQALTATKKYLWNYELITYTDNSTATINPVIIGVYGDKGNQGDKGTDAVTFQVYAPNGYLLTKDLSEITLQTFAYEGSVAITSGATYQWAQYIEDAWENISGATTQTLAVAKDEVVKSKSYKCTMTYKSKQYTATATVQDKTDIYDSLIQTIAKYSSTNRLYWVLYSTVYTEEGEKDKLLGPVSTTVPTSPTTGAYWYKIDETNYTVTLMKYSGTAWATTTDKQELVYDWFLFNDVDNTTPLGSQNKVKIITSNDFNKICSVQCNIYDSESTPITYSNQILTDPSDPVVSSVEPINPVHGQLWIKTGENGLYTLLAWDASLEQWIVSETDSRVKVHISKPVSYEVGDVWVVGSDYEPTIYINGVAQATKYLAGTLLKAQYSSQSYKDSDWVEALNYQKEIDTLKENLNTYNQFFSFDEDGLTMQAKNKSGVVSEFKTKLTNTELGFYQGENKVAHINNNQLNISKAEITNGMTITGQAPVLEIGNFVIIQESNGSLSIGLKG